MDNSPAGGGFARQPLHVRDTRTERTKVLWNTMKHNIIRGVDPPESHCKPSCCFLHSILICVSKQRSEITPVFNLVNMTLIQQREPIMIEKCLPETECLSTAS